MNKLLLSLSILSTSLASAQSPGGIQANNTVWIKANEGVTVNAANTTVTTWNEYSGANILGNFSTQGAAINKPTHQAPLFVESGINFNPYIRFNSTATPNSISSGNAVAGGDFLDPTNNIMFQVINLKQSTGTGVWIKWQWGTNSYSGPRLGNEVNNPGNLGRPRFDFRAPSLYAPTNILNQHTLMTQYVNGNERAIRITGKTDATNVPTGTANYGATTGRLTVGAEPYGDDYPTNVDVAELIIYKGTLTALEILKIESYLAVKYGVTLEQTGAYANNYLNASGTIIWSNSVNTGYRYNITGIARDDASALMQKQSRSINTGTGLVTIYAGNAGPIFPLTNNSNTATIGQNNSYVLFGDNNQALVLNGCVANGKGVGLERKWKVQTIGNLGASTLTINKSEYPTGITTLYVADDENFNINVEAIPLQDNGTTLFAAFNANGKQYKYFTFGTTPFELNAINDTICNNSFGSIITNPTGGIAPVTYSWNSNPIQTSSSLIDVVGGNYTVTITHNNGLCQFTENAGIIENPTVLDADILDIERAMCTSGTGSLNIVAYNGVTPYQYKVDNEPFSFNSNIRNLASGPHRITIKDAYNCSIDTIIFIGRDSVDIRTEVDTRDAWCDLNGLGGYAKITVANAHPPLSYNWNNVGAVDKNMYNNLAKGVYKIDIVDFYGCKTNLTFELKETPCCELFLPNAFTPNNDGLNDKFISNTTTDIPHYNMRIYDRWGQAVFVSGNHDIGWDGNDYRTNQPCDNAVYYYYLEYKCPVQNVLQIKKGEVTLLR